MSYHRNQNSLSKIFHIIDSNLSKFYSSRPHISQKSSQCPCKVLTEQKKLQINFYSEQKEMIIRVGQHLMQDSRTNDQKIISKILFMSVDYINKILQFLNQQFLCQCKKAIINQSIVMKHKIQFMRQQNDKFFKLLQQKNSECQKLEQKLKQYSNIDSQDIRPITARNQQANKQNIGSSSMGLIPKSINVSSQHSIKSSKISELHDHLPKGQIGHVFQKDHNSYFKVQLDRKQKKSKIFY